MLFWPSLVLKKIQNPEINFAEKILCTLRALSDERFLAAGGQAAFAMSHERFGR